MQHSRITGGYIFPSSMRQRDADPAPRANALRPSDNSPSRGHWSTWYNARDPTLPVMGLW